MASEAFGKNHAAELAAELDSVQSVDDFGREWKTKWRLVAVTIQGILAWLYPDGAKVMGYIISVVDRCCAAPQQS